jgi:hypothetical protein
VRTNYQLDFGIPLAEQNHGGYPHSEKTYHVVESSVFSFNGETVFIADSADGYLYISKLQTDGTHTEIMRVGNVNYKTGLLELIGFEPESYFGNAIKFYVLPKDKDVGAVKNSIIGIEPDEIHIDVEGIK